MKNLQILTDEKVRNFESERIGRKTESEQAVLENEKEIEKRAGGSACMKKETIEQLSLDEPHNITIVLQ